MLKRNSVFFPENKTAKSPSHAKIPKSLCEFGKTWNYSLRPILKNPNFESMDNLGKSRS